MIPHANLILSKSAYQVFDIVRPANIQSLLLPGPQPSGLPPPAGHLPVPGPRHREDPPGVQPRLLGRGHQRVGGLRGLRHGRADLLPVLGADAP